MDYVYVFSESGVRYRLYNRCAIHFLTVDPISTGPYVPTRPCSEASLSHHSRHGTYPGAFSRERKYDHTSQSDCDPCHSDEKIVLRRSKMYCDQHGRKYVKIKGSDKGERRFYLTKIPALSKKACLLSLIQAILTDFVAWGRVVTCDVSHGNSTITDINRHRFLQVADDFGQVWSRYYGRSAGETVKELWKDHLMLIITLIETTCSIERDRPAKNLATLQQNLVFNAEDIARFLEQNNPHFEYAELLQHLLMTLHLITQMIRSHMKGQHREAIQCADRLHDHVIMVTRYMTDAIYTHLLKSDPHRKYGDTDRDKSEHHKGC